MPPDGELLQRRVRPVHRNGRSNSASVAWERGGGFGPQALRRMRPTIQSEPVASR